MFTASCPQEQTPTNALQLSQIILYKGAQTNSKKSSSWKELHKMSNEQAATQHERFSLIRHSNNFPEKSLKGSADLIFTTSVIQPLLCNYSGMYLVYRQSIWSVCETAVVCDNRCMKHEYYQTQISTSHLAGM